MTKIDRIGWAAGLAAIAYGRRIGLRVSDAGALERTSACLPPGWKAAAHPVVDSMYSLVVGSSGGRIRRFNLLYRGTERIARSHDIDEVYAALEEDLKLHVATSSPARVFVHAGVVGWRGGAIVLPGRTFAGKSTLVDALVRAGATYYSDEYAVLDERGRVHPFARALKLRARPGDPAQAPPESASGPVGTRPLPVRLVALTHYRAGSRWRSAALSPGQALLAVMEHTVPVRHRPEATLKTLREVVTRAAVIKGVRGEVDEAVKRLLSAVDSAAAWTGESSRARREGLARAGRR
jgi:hypothetical protein